MHIHGGEPEEGPAVLKHRIHAMLNDVPLFLDGKFVSVRQLDPSGKAVVIDTEFRGLGTFPVYPYPHPETITLPRHIPGLLRATNMGVIFPLPYFELTQEMVRVGACGEEPLQVGKDRVVPIEFSVAHILSQRARLLKEAGITGPAGALKVVVAGKKGGKPRTFVFQLSSKTAGAGEGTGIPAAAGAAWLATGATKETGVFPPEALVPPLEILPIALGMGKKMGVSGGDTVHIESIDEQGNRTPVPLPG
jgi:saccharopine dehydrogenase-like NADP-dependent oxidoreductase